jgi:xylan 1,4-beta-xylosidase
VLSTNGIALPVLNVFRMFGQMGGKRLAVESSGEVALEAIRNRGVRGNLDVSALARLEDGRLSVLAWHHHDDDVPGATADVELSLSNLPAGARRLLLTHYRIDIDHGNAFEAWKSMGSPPKPTPEQHEALERALDLTLLGSPRWLQYNESNATVRLSLPRQAISQVVFDWNRRPK